MKVTNRFATAMATGALALLLAHPSYGDIAAPPPDTNYGTEDWCSNNRQGLDPKFGDPNNPCAKMCGTVNEMKFAIAGALASLTSDLVGMGSGGEQWSLCLAAAGFDARSFYHTLNDPWCGDHPVTCTYNLVATGICGFSECFTNQFAPLKASTKANWASAALAAVCNFAPIASVSIERYGIVGYVDGYREQCRQHIQQEISMPINPQQGCFCDRVEMYDPGVFYQYRECAASANWAEIGTAEANCRDHDSSWLPVASGSCRAAGSSNGSSFYRYRNCRFVRNNDRAGWAQFQQALQQFRNGVLRLQVVNQAIQGQ